jgi:TRAP-type C4-dicarboxylate transport system permease small subunit
MTGFLSRWNGRVTTWLARIAAFILAVLAVVTFCDVFARYFFNAPFTFTVELTELSMGLIVYLAVGYTTHEEGHITVDIVTLRLTDRFRAIVAMLTNAVALAFLSVMVWRLWLRAEFLFQKGDVTPIWHQPIWPVAFVMAAGSVFLLTGVLLHFLRALGRVRGDRSVA